MNTQPNCEQRIENDPQTQIEHIRPKSCPLYRTDMFNYTNLLACCDGGVNERLPTQYCGQRKDSWYDEALFVSPLNPNCENYFLFTVDGQILPTDDPTIRRAAEETIARLNLQDGYLNRRRKEAIGVVIGDMGEYNDPQISDMIDQYAARDQQRRFSPFCSAIVNILRQFR